MVVKTKIDALKAFVLAANVRIQELLDAKAALEADKANLEAQVADLQTKVMGPEDQEAVDSVEQFLLDNPLK